jgi:hypothetical protein
MRIPATWFALALGIGLAAAPAFAHAASYVELYQQVPAPSKDIAATRTAAHDGKITDAGILRFKQVLQDEKTAIAALNGGSYPAFSETAPTVPATESPEVQSATRAFAAYLAANSGTKTPAMAMAKRSRWVQRAKGQQQRDLAKRAVPCADPCQDAAALTANQAVAAQREKLIGEELILWDALFKDWQKTRAPMLATAQPLLAATDGGAKALTAEGRTAVARYRAAMLEEVELLFSLTELAVLRTDAFSRNAGDAMPDALSGATRKKTP